MKKPNRKKRKIVVGVTGSFGSGKTTVARIFKKLGAEVINADEISALLLKEPVTYKKIIRAFGRGIIRGKAIDRLKLARMVFAHQAKLRELNKIMHPQVIRIIGRKIKSASSKIIILDAPLIVETGLHKRLDKLIVVKALRKQQIERVSRKNRLLKKQDILKRISAQAPLKEKLRFADFVIDNSLGIEQTKQKVGKIWRMLWKN